MMPRLRWRGRESDARYANPIKSIDIQIQSYNPNAIHHNNNPLMRGLPMGWDAAEVIRFDPPELANRPPSPTHHHHPNQRDTMRIAQIKHNQAICRVFCEKFNCFWCPVSLPTHRKHRNANRCMHDKPFWNWSTRSQTLMCIGTDNPMAMTTQLFINPQIEFNGMDSLRKINVYFVLMRISWKIFALDLRLRSI